MSSSAFVVLSLVPLIVLLFAVLSAVDAAPLKHRRTQDVDSGNLPATRSVTYAVARDDGPDLPAAISRSLPAKVRSLLGERASASWSTAGSGALALSDSTLNIVRGSGPKYTYLTFAGKKALRAFYPKGSYRPGATDAPKGGISFYAKGPKSVDLTTAREATFSYSIYFQEGFEWVQGGKLPGFYGGDDEQVSMSCSGGRRDTRCFSARLMWRPEGQGEMYTYLPPYDMPGFEANKKQCSVPHSDCNPTYGTSLNRGSFHFKAGAWTDVKERVKLNTPGKADGELELIVGGKSVINVNGLIIRDNDKGRIRGIQMESFFGGHTKDWATPKDQYVYYADLAVAITEAL